MIKDAVNQERVKSSMTPRVQRPKNKTFNILALDGTIYFILFLLIQKFFLGGGLKAGIHPILVRRYRIHVLEIYQILFHRICEQIPDFLDKVDLFTGTSAGISTFSTAKFPGNN
jgi:hypothetical protein